jgi:hypothetical protein
VVIGVYVTAEVLDPTVVDATRLIACPVALLIVFLVRVGLKHDAPSQPVTPLSAIEAGGATRRPTPRRRGDPPPEVTRLSA